MNPLVPALGLILFAALVVALVLAYLVLRGRTGDPQRNALVGDYLRDPGAHPDWMTRANSRCEGSPFAFPTDGFVGYLWGDAMPSQTRHQGIDVFGNLPLGQTPVFSASDGFLTRLADWMSAVIVRVPDDPLVRGRTIWIYYAHMADPEGRSFIDAEFPPGTMEKPVKMGQKLGYQGNYSGDPASPTGVHLHLSIVLGDGRGGFRNEIDIANTLDPSPYFGMDLNAASAGYGAPRCQEAEKKIE